VSEAHPDDVLRDALILLRASVARELAKQIDAGGASPAVLEAARKFLGDQLRPESRSKAPPVTRNLPYPAE